MGDFWDTLKATRIVSSTEHMCGRRNWITFHDSSFAVWVDHVDESVWSLANTLPDDKYRSGTSNRHLGQRGHTANRIRNGSHEGLRLYDLICIQMHEGYPHHI